MKRLKALQRPGRRRPRSDAQRKAGSLADETRRDLTTLLRDLLAEVDRHDEGDVRKTGNGRVDTAE